MFKAVPVPQTDSRIERYALTQDGRPVMRLEVFSLMRSSADFRAVLTATLASCPFDAFRWETPCMGPGLDELPAEFVLVDSPGLERGADFSSFEEKFVGTGANVLAFDNLGGDATMVVPRPHGAPSAYGHLAAFVRNADPAQVDELWKTTAAAGLERYGLSPLWMSTAGAGVPWLHVRLDSRPKYYAFAEYRSDSA